LTIEYLWNSVVILLSIELHNSTFVNCLDDPLIEHGIHHFNKTGDIGPV